MVCLTKIDEYGIYSILTQQQMHHIILYQLMNTTAIYQAVYYMLCNFVTMVE